MHTTVSTIAPSTLLLHQTLALVCLQHKGLKWRRHGIGLIQAYLREKNDAFDFDPVLAEAIEALESVT